MSDIRFWQDSSQRLVFEMFRVPSSDYPELCKAIATDFSLTPDYESFTAGLDAISMCCRRGDQVAELAWDNWTGFMVIARSASSELLVREIAAWLLQSAWSKGGERVSLDR